MFVQPDKTNGSRLVVLPRCHNVLCSSSFVGLTTDKRVGIGYDVRRWEGLAFPR